METIASRKESSNQNVSNFVHIYCFLWPLKQNYDGNSSSLLATGVTWRLLVEFVFLFFYLLLFSRNRVRFTVLIAIKSIGFQTPNHLLLFRFFSDRRYLLNLAPCASKNLIWRMHVCAASKLFIHKNFLQRNSRPLSILSFSIFDLAVLAIQQSCTEMVFSKLIFSFIFIWFFRQCSFPKNGNKIHHVNESKRNQSTHWERWKETLCDALSGSSTIIRSNFSFICLTITQWTNTRPPISNYYLSVISSIKHSIKLHVIWLSIPFLAPIFLTNIERVRFVFLCVVVMCRPTITFHGKRAEAKKKKKIGWVGAWRSRRSHSRPLVTSTFIRIPKQTIQSFWEITEWCRISDRINSNVQFRK